MHEVKYHLRILDFDADFQGLLCLRQHLPVFFLYFLLLLPTADPPIKNLGSLLVHSCACALTFYIEIAQNIWDVTELKIFPGYNDTETRTNLNI